MVKKIFNFLDENIEKYIILISYSAMAWIIFSEVINRFVFSKQSPWSTSIPIYLFLWLTWMGCSYNTKHRSHLRFNELRERLSYNKQYLCLVADALCWYAFGGIVVYYWVDPIVLLYDNYAIVDGTNDIMQWWFYIMTPFAWCLLLVRVTQNLIVDTKMFRAKEPLIITTALLQD
ncbi:MAG: TRAP transporter small permease [Arenicella sp.]